MKLLVKLLSIPLDSHSIKVLSMNHYPGLMQYMKFNNKRQVALKIVKVVIKDNVKLTSTQTVEQLIKFIMSHYLKYSHHGKVKIQMSCYNSMIFKSRLCHFVLVDAVHRSLTQKSYIIQAEILRCRRIS